MASEYCVYKSKELIDDYDFFVSEELLGEQIYYYRHCYYLRDFLSESSLSERYLSNDIIRILPHHSDTLLAELQHCLVLNKVPEKDLVHMYKFSEILKDISNSNVYNYYLDYCD